MKFRSIAVLAAFSFAMSVPAFAHEDFADGEASFKLVMDKLLEHYVDRSLTREDLYRAATAGMLDSLNSGGSGKESWNKLLSPEEQQELQADLAGKTSGVGVTIKFDERLGYGRVLGVIPGSPAEKAGLKADDQILSVDGKKFKGRAFRDLVFAIRGKVGEPVGLRILREDRVLAMELKREVIPVSPVEFEKLDDSTALLTLEYFTADAPATVEKKLEEFRSRKLERLIVDLRQNSGGGFEQAIHTAELFVPKGQLIASTRDRSGATEEFRSSKGLLAPETQLIVLADKGTTCGAELFIAALKENRRIRIVGEPTFGKWNTQIVELLPNHYAVKYTVKDFFAPSGHSFENAGIKPDVEVAFPEGRDVRELRSGSDMHRKLELDPQLKAAYELTRG